MPRKKEMANGISLTVLLLGPLYPKANKESSSSFALPSIHRLSKKERRGEEGGGNRGRTRECLSFLPPGRRRVRKWILMVDQVRDVVWSTIRFHIHFL